MTVEIEGSYRSFRTRDEAEKEAVAIMRTRDDLFIRVVYVNVRTWCVEYIKEPRS